MPEQLIIDILYFFTHNIFQIILYYLSMRFMLTPKNNVCEAAIIIVFPLINAACLPLAQYFTGIMRLVILTALTVIPAVLLFKEPKKRCIFAAFVLMLLLTITDIIASAIVLKQYGYYPFNVTPKNWDSVIVSLMADLMFLTFILPACIIWRKKFMNIENRSFGLFILFPISQVLFLCAFSYKTWTSKDFSVFDNAFAVIALIVSLVADIAMYRALKENSEVEKIKLRMEEMERSLEMQFRYYEALAEKYDEIRKYRHDINNLLSAAEALIQNNISPSDGAALIKEMKEKASDMSIPVFCSNPMVNTVLWQKKRTAEELGVKLEISMEFREDFPFERFDICSLFVNLADNAISEAQKHKKSVITVKAARKIGKLFIEFTNPLSEDIISGKEKLKTTKSDENHGHGIEIINKIAEKYDGSFTLKYSEGFAVARVCLTIPETD